MKLTISKELIHSILTWIEEGYTKDTRNPNYNPELGTILNKIKEYAKERGMRFTQTHMSTLFKMDISKISSWSTLDAAYYAKHQKANTVTELEFDFGIAEEETIEAEDEAYLADKADVTVEEDVSWL